MPTIIPRGVEVLIKKAAFDPAFKKILLEKRAGAADAIGLNLTVAEEAMLAAVPIAHLEGIIAHTRVAPKSRPAFLGYAAGAMLAALGTATLLSDAEMKRGGETRTAAASYSKKRVKAKGRFPGEVRMEERGSWPYGLAGGARGGGSAGSRADRPGRGYAVATINSRGGSAGIRADRVVEPDPRP